MLNKFKPTWMVNSLYSITPEQLRALNIRVVLTDLDNTLIAWNDPKASAESIQWIDKMEKAGIPVVILSNNSDERIRVVAEILNIEYISRSMKPSRRAFRQAEEMLNVSADEIVMIGDQLITDVFGANRHGVRSILVKPLLSSDAWQTKFNRFLELRIMNLLAKNDPELEWRDSLDEPT